DLAVGVPDHARHPALVSFPGAIDVEELQARPAPRRRRARLLLPQGPAIEVVLAPAVEIEGMEPLRVRPIVESPRPITISRGARGVDQGYPSPGAPAPEVLRVFDVIAPQVIPVGLGRVAAGSEVEDRVDPQGSTLQGLQEVEMLEEAEVGQAGEVGCL